MIVFGVQIAARSTSRFWTSAWMLVRARHARPDPLVDGARRRARPSRSSPLYLWLVRRVPAERRIPWYIVGSAIAAAGVALVLVFRTTLLALLGKSPDLTNRLDIWDTVIGLANQRPVVGWGWIGYWAPWVEPFDDLVVIKGVHLPPGAQRLDRRLPAARASSGSSSSAALVISTLGRSWARAVDLPRARGKAIGLLPILVMVMLIVHSLAESRLLIEIGFALLVVFAIRTRSNRGQNLHLPGRATPA